MCKCGVEKHTKEELESYIERRHADGGNCPHKGYKMSTKFKFSIEKHVSNQHFNEFYYWCDYCTSYQTDQKNLMDNHLGAKHGYGLKRSLAPSLGVTSCSHLKPAEMNT